jgi:gliding motility-associated-like protein
MSSINNIDELLKNSFNNFEATPPPDAWNAIQQGLPNTGVSGTESTVSNASTIIKSTALVTKIVVAIASIATIAGVYFTYNYFDNHSNEKINQTAQQPSVQIHPNSEVNKLENIPTTKQNIVASSNTEKKNNSGKNEAAKPVSETQTVSTENVPANVENNKLDIQQPNPDNKKIVTPIVEQKGIQNQQKTQPTQQLKSRKDYFASDEKQMPATANENQYQKPNIHNAITPNNDGENDRMIIEIENESLYELKIYDAENNLVFESNNKDKTWDGLDMRSGQIGEVGQYQYVFKYQYKNSEKVHTTKGVILLNR